MYAFEVPEFIVLCTKEYKNYRPQKFSSCGFFYCQKINSKESKKKLKHCKKNLKTTEHMQITFELALCGFNNCLSDYELN